MDGLPEIREYYRLMLLSVISHDGQETTSHSGASIDPLGSSTNITLEENDLPNGLLQFSSSGVGTKDGVIPIASQQAQV